MGKRNKVDVRLHEQEREWLQNLGGGNIVEGAKSVIQELSLKASENDNSKSEHHRQKR